MLAHNIISLTLVAPEFLLQYHSHNRILMPEIRSGKITHACWVNVHAFAVCCLLTFFKLNFSQYSFGNNISVSNSLDPDLGPNCLQRLLTEDKKPSLARCLKKKCFNP